MQQITLEQARELLDIVVRRVPMTREDHDLCKAALDRLYMTAKEAEDGRADQ